VRLRNAQELASLGLRQPPCSEHLEDLQCQARLEQFLPGIRQAEIGEDVAVFASTSIVRFVAMCLSLR
jgi:hypothetical protein